MAKTTVAEEIAARQAADERIREIEIRLPEQPMPAAPYQGVAIVKMR